MYNIYFADADRLLQAMKDYSGNVENAINEVLHNEIGDLAQTEIKRLMPVSGKHWNGKKAAAKTSNSLRNLNEHLSVTVRTQKSHQYLYFPDDGTNTRRHIGNQRFFARGGENIQGEIIERCEEKLVNNFEKGV